MNNRFAQWKSLSPAGWLRVAGIFVLVCGLGGAALLFWRAQFSARTIDELMPGYAEARSRQRGILMGTFVAQLMDGVEALREPRTQAVVLAVAATLTALGCFRLASMIREE
jgi:hypothetical protein